MSYDQINSYWNQHGSPPLTRHEAHRALKALRRHFGKVVDASPLDRYGVERTRNMSTKPPPSQVRRCWIVSVPLTGDSHRGWPRLVHDISHDVFSWRHPGLRPHHSAHSRLESEILAYVVAKGWLEGKLKPPEKPKPTLSDRRLSRLARIEERLKKWESRAKRAATTLKKLKRQRAVLRRKIGA